MGTVLWALILCLLCGTGREWAQALPTPAKKSAGVKSKHSATPAAQPATPAATTPSETTAPAPPPAPVDPLGRTTPHGSVLGFLRAAEVKNFAKAAQYL